MAAVNEVNGFWLSDLPVTAIAGRHARAFDGYSSRGHGDVRGAPSFIRQRHRIIAGAGDANRLDELLLTPVPEIAGIVGDAAPPSGDELRVRWDPGDSRRP